jgi:predicted alpha-1,2-mannosidase
MKKLFLPALLLSIFLLSCKNENAVVYHWNVAPAQTDFAKYVNPFVGTGGHGHTFPGATAPFGMVQLSPDTRADDSWDGCSGYHYSDSLIYGFSHTHLSGTGCSDYGDFLFMAGTGSRMITNSGKNGASGYRRGFSHKDETASAGYYKVKLDNEVVAELTASPRVGFHRYTFPKSPNAWIVLDLRHRDELMSSEIKYVNDHAICGYRTSKAWAQDQKLWFYAEFSKPYEVSDLSFPNVNHADIFSFGLEEGGTVELKVSVSAVSWENAKLNMETEVPGWDFDAVRKKTEQQWNNELGRIEVKDTSETKKRIFYTALYHCFIAPNLYCDVNGDYRGRDNKIHRDTIHPQYTVFSLWDTHRALHPLFTLIQPERNQDFINTFLKQYKEGGRLPVWELSANETDCMIGHHSIPVIVDSWMKGQTGFDTALAYEAMKSSVMEDVRGMKEYKKYGYIPAEGESESVSKTLEYAYDDWCVAQAAKRMGKDEDYKYFMRRSQSWRNVFDPETKFARARMNNAFVRPFAPEEVNFHYTEANSWQYSLYVPHDINGMISELGGKDSLCAWLDRLFNAPAKTSGREQADITGLIGQYAHGNEPSHHLAYLYSFAGQPLRASMRVRQIMSTMYADAPDGLCGNEDCGQMSAWYVMSALGIYEVSPGSNQYITNTPAFDEVILHLDNGRTFTFQTAEKHVAPANYFVDSVFVNGQRRTEGWITPVEIANGGQMTFWLGHNPLDYIETPDPYLMPVTYTAPADGILPGERIPRVPFTTSATRTFTGQMEIALKGDPGSQIMYRQANGSWQNYSQPVRITENTAFEASAYSGGQSSDTAHFEFFRAPAWKSITLKNPYAPQYAAGGDRALIDGLKGPANFRTGSWQGYDGKDVDAVIDLGSERDISQLSIGFLQEQNSWIFMPEEVSFLVSTDGRNFQEYGREKNAIDQKKGGTIIYNFTAQKNVKARYVKVVAKNRGICPDWHPGKGNPAWIFADELTITTR